MDKNELKKKKKRKVTMIIDEILKKLIPWFCFSFAVIVMLRSSPAQFPLPIDRENIDCSKIQITNISNIDNKINIQVETENFIEFPQNAAPLMLRIETKVNNFISTFTNPGFWDIERNESSYSFNILQKSPGNITVSVFCQNFKLKSQNLEIDSLSVYTKRTSHILSETNHTLEMNNICYNNSNFQFITEINNSEFYYKASSDLTVNISITTSSIDKITYLHKLNNPFSKIYIVTVNPKDANDMLIDYVLPHYIQIQKEGNFPILILNHSENLAKTMKKLTDKEIFAANNHRCINTAIFLPSTGSVGITNNLELTRTKMIEYIIESNLESSKLKSLFDIDENIETKQKIVDLTRNTANIPKYPSSFEVIRFNPNNDIENIINAIKDTKYMVIDDESFMFAYFMPKSSIFVDLSNSSQAKRLAEQLGIKYQTNL